MSSDYGSIARRLVNTRTLGVSLVLLGLLAVMVGADASAKDAAAPVAAVDVAPTPLPAAIEPVQMPDALRADPTDPGNGEPMAICCWNGVECEERFGSGCEQDEIEVACPCGTI